MAGLGGWRRTRRWHGAAVVVAVGALLAGANAVPARAQASRSAPPPSQVTGVTGLATLRPHQARPYNAAASGYRATAVSWPAASSAGIDLATHPSLLSPDGQASTPPPLVVPPPAQVYGTGLPVWAQALTPPRAASGSAKASPAGAVSGEGPARAEVRVLGHAAADAAGVAGVVFTVAPGGTGSGPVRVGLDYSGFAQAYGGNYGLGLRLVRLPACALTTPRRAACRAETPLPSVNDPAAQSVSATISLAAAQPGQAGGPAVLLAAAPAPGPGSAGNYSATSLRASGSWTAGGSSGSFTYSYPVQVPPAASSLVPSLSLNYDSGTVDGQTAATQAQSSWAGDGWSTPASYIEQSFISCSDSPEGSASPSATSDNCYDGPILTLSLDGASTQLVCNAAETACTAADDQGEAVTHVTGSGNGSGTYNTDYWMITDRSGTVYEFGRNELPGWSSGKPATNSVDSEPVFSAHSGDPCYSASGFASSACTMAYRWNLDYVKDTHANAMAYYYKQDTGAYAKDGNTASATAYVRDSHLDHIDYGFTDPGAYTAPAPDQVVFTPGDRCVSGTCDPLNATNAANWPDVPYALNCSAGASCQNTGPSFWSTVRLTKITTQQRSGSAYVPVDSWALAEHFPATGDSTSPTLWLDSITRTGSDTSAGGAAVTLPPVTFTATALANRVDTVTDGLPPLTRFRVGSVTTEAGAVIGVKYAPVSPCTAPVTVTPSANTSSCYPVYWTPPGYTQPFLDWFSKYAVASVSVGDQSGGSNGLFTAYTYKGGGAWHYDDNEIVKPKYRTYGQWHGYEDVITDNGQGGDAPTETEDTYYRGMDGDTLPGSGTRSVTLTDSQGAQHTDSLQLAGDALESTAYNYAGGPIDHSSISSYWVSAAAATRIRSGLPALTANATGQVESWTRQAITGGGSTTWRKTETDTSYDATPADAAFGLPLFTYAHGDLSVPAQQTCTATTYAPANTAKNITGLPAEAETDAQPCGGPDPGGASAPGAGQVNALTAPATLSRPADVISDTRTFYDNPALAGTWPQPASPAWPQAAPTAGDVSVVRQASGYTGGAFSYITKNATIYDSYGRPVTTYDANGNTTTTAYTTTGGLTTAQTVTNALAQAVTTTLDPERAIPVSSTDANNVTTTLHYDGLGRLTSVWGYGRATTLAASDIYTYAVSPTAPTVVTTQRLNDGGGYITSTTLYDSLLRVRQTQVPTPQGGRLISDTFYDTRGWAGKTNTNYWDSANNPGTSIVTVPDSQVHQQAVTAFDGLGRPVLVTSNDELTVKSVTATAYYGDRVTTVPPPGGTPASTVTDALGRTTELDQYTSRPSVATSTAGGITTVAITGGTSQATDYLYNHRGEQSDIKDAASGADWNTTYNLLGQVTGKNDPDAGASAMSYDSNGNLTATTDADGHTLTYTYDPLNRKTGLYDGSSAGSPQLASWVYDNSNGVSGVTDPIGQLTTETSYSGGNAYTMQQKGFNAFGESAGETVTLPAAEGALAGSYTLTHTYSTTTGLPGRDTYPASPGGGALPAETITHGYTPALYLPAGISSSLAAYTQSTTYDAYFRVTGEEVGSTTSNATVASAYDLHTGALTDSQVKNTAVSATPFDDTSYAYDPAGNITSETDTRNGTASETQCYGYDTLDRLTQAWTATDNCAADPSANNGATVGDGISGSAYWTSWSFDPLGERTQQTAHSLTGAASTVTSYAYNGNGTAQPNTLTSATAAGPSGTATSSFTYDPAGNTLTRDLPSGNQALTWNHTGQLATDTTAAGTASYLYDASGNLLLQKDPAQTTLYVFGEQIVLTAATGAITGTRVLALPGGGQVVRTGAGTAYTFEFTDQHGTGVLTLSSAAQSPAWRQFTPYGAPRGTPPVSWPDANAFLGKPADAATGLTSLGARQYDPVTGRFLSPDPVLDPASPQELNGYTYAAANPVTGADPTGLHSVPPPGESGCPSSDPGCPGYRGPGGPTAGAGGGQDNPVPSPGVGSGPTARYPSPQPGPVAIPPRCIGRGCARAELAPAGPSPFLDLLRDVSGTVLSCAMRINDGRCPLRMPDYYSFNYSFTPLVGVPIVVNLNVTITRHGNVFYGGSAGFGPPGASGAVRGGYIDQPHVPSSSEVSNFVHGSFVSGEVTPAVYPVPVLAGVGPSAAETWGSPYPPHGGTHNFATEVGIGFDVDQPGTLTGGYAWGGWSLP